MLDDGLAEAHSSMGFIALVQWDWLNAEKEFKRAVALNPNYATAHHWYGLYFRSLGRWQEALAEAERVQQLDPLFTPLALGGILYEMGLYDRAIAVFTDWLEVTPGTPGAYGWLADCYVKKRMYQEAISKSQQALALSRNSAYFQAWLARIYAQTGHRDRALTILEELRAQGNPLEVNPEQIANVYVALDNKDLAFEWLEKAYELRSDALLMLKSSAYEPLRGDPRYADLMHRIGFPQ